MMRAYLRVCVVTLVFFLTASLQACSDTAPKVTPPGTPAQGSNVNSSSALRPAPAGHEGFQDITNCNAILAWAWDMNRPNDPIKLDIYDGNALLANVTADVFRQDLLDAGKGNGKHGLNFPVPPKLKDGKSHTIEIRFAGTDVALKNGPKELICTP